MNYFVRQEIRQKFHKLAAQSMASSLQEMQSNWAMRLSVCSGFLRNEMKYFMRK